AFSCCTSSVSARFILLLLPSAIIYSLGLFMFIEPLYTKGKGWIEVICGSMFSGKTEELIRRLRRAQIAHLRVEIFKPSVDRRYAEYDVVSHNDLRIRCTPVSSSQNILLLADEVDVVGIDEAQFLDTE